MRTASLALMLLGLLSAGCTSSSAKSASAKPTPAATADQDEVHYENFRSGLFQIDNAVGALEDGLSATKALAGKTGGEAKGALLDVADMLDSSGATLSDANVDAPTLEEFKKQFPAYDDRRLKGIDSAIDAYQETRHARGVLVDLSETAPKNLVEDLKRIIETTDDAIDAMSEAIVSLGGKVPKDVTVDESDADSAPPAATSPQKGN